MAILSKACKPDNFESHNSLKLGFTNTRGLRSNFVDCEFFLESSCPDILALCETNLVDSTDSGNFSVRGYVLAVYVKEGLPFALNLSLENCRFLFMFPNGFTSLSVLLLFPLLIISFIFVHDF